MVVIAVAVVMILPCTHNNKLSDIRHTLEHPSLTSVLRETHSLGATRIFNWLWKSLASASEDFLGTTYVNLSHLYDTLDDKSESRNHANFQFDTKG